MASIDISDPGPVRSSMGISRFGARRDGWGYLSTRRFVPSTIPGSISSSCSVVLLLLNSGEEEEGGEDDDDHVRYRSDDDDDNEG